MKRIQLILLLATIFLGSCATQKSLRETLSDAELLMNESPDSALFLLGAIESTSIKSKKTKAEYDLLLSMALDKNYIDLKTDSLIINAVEYYRLHRDYERRFLSLFYLGRVQYNASQYEKAIVSYTEAEQIIDKVESNYTKGLLYANLAGVYEKTYDYLRFLEAGIKAEQYYKAANRITHQKYSRLLIGKAYIYLNQFDKAEDIIKDVLTWCLENKEYSAYVEGRKTYLSLLMLSERIYEIFEVFSEKEINSYDLLSKNYLLAYKAALDNDTLGVADYLNSAWSLAKNAQDSVTMYHNGYRVYKVLGNYHAALEEHEKLLISQDKTLRQSLRQPLLAAQRDFFHSEAENQSLRLKNNRIMTICGIVFVILFIVLIIVYYSYKLVQKQRKLDSYIDLYKELEERSSDKESKMDIKLQNLLSRQYDLLNQLCKLCYETPESTKKNAVYSKVKNEIELFKSDNKNLDNLEQIVNECKNGVMKKIRDELPMLTPQEYRLLCFFYSGFSAKTISIFTDETTNNIYVKKKRIRDKIIALKPNAWQEMIQYME